MKKQTEKSKSGRKRDTHVDQIILMTTLKDLVEHGYARTSIEMIANEAGVGKTSIYRRYKNKKDLFAAAISSIIQDVSLPPDTGDTHSDLTGALFQFRNYAESKMLYSLIGTLLAEADRDPELIRLFREKIIAPRREQIRLILQKGIERLDVHPDMNIDSTIDALYGAFITRFLSGEVADDLWIVSVVDTVWKGISR